MKKKSVTGTAALITCFIGSALSPLVAGQQPAWRDFSQRRPYTGVDDMLNKDAEASDSAGIHYYAEDLAHMLLPEKVGDDYINSFADRLAKAEEAAREGKGELIPESDVVRAFNELMMGIGAPPSTKADVDDLREFRAHAAAIRAFPAVLTEDRSGTNCNPSEAVYLISMLIDGRGKLSQHLLDNIVQMGRAINDINDGQGFAVTGTSSGPLLRVGGGPVTIVTYCRHHRSATRKLFDKLAKTLGF